MTPKNDQMTPECDYCRRNSHHRLMTLLLVRYTKYYVHISYLLSISMKILTSPISNHYRYSHNYQSNVYHIKYNLVQQNASTNSRIDKYSDNKATYINTQEINYSYSSYNQHIYFLILHVY
jgi:hypothetical protein